MFEWPYYVHTYKLSMNARHVHSVWFTCRGSFGDWDNKTQHYIVEPLSLEDNSVNTSSLNILPVIGIRYGITSTHPVIILKTFSPSSYLRTYSHACACAVRVYVHTYERNGPVLCAVLSHPHCINQLSLECWVRYLVTWTIFQTVSLLHYPKNYYNPTIPELMHESLPLQLEQPHSMYLAEDANEEEGECGMFYHGRSITVNFNGKNKHSSSTIL